MESSSVAARSKVVRAAGRMVLLRSAEPVSDAAHGLEQISASPSLALSRATCMSTVRVSIRASVFHAAWSS